MPRVVDARLDRCTKAREHRAVAQFLRSVPSRVISMLGSVQAQRAAAACLLCLLVSSCSAQSSYYRRGESRYSPPQSNQYNVQQQSGQYNGQQNQNQYSGQQLRSSQYSQYEEPAQQQVRSFGGGSGGACPEPNGRFPVASQCDAYIECTNGVPEQKLCPEGLLFNPEARFNYPCGYPIDVQCLGRTSLQPEQPTEDCPHQFGYFKMGDRQNCGKFKNCVDGRAYVFDCPEGLAYNSETYRCDWPDQVADCDAEAFLGFTCPTSGQNTFLSSEARFYRSPTDCQRYYVCVENRPRLQNCGKGHAFNELIGTCDAAENVTGCEPPPSLNQEFDQVQLDEPQQNLRSFNTQQRTYNQQQNSYDQQNLYNQQQNLGSFNQQASTGKAQQNSRRNQQNNQYSRQRFSNFKK